jgi:Mrp family chromosome partitioning ATPase
MLKIGGWSDREFMSKNFELLQHVGTDEELFRTTGQSGDAVPAADAETSPDLDKETLERILQKASLPDVFQIANEPGHQSPILSSEHGSDLRGESASKNLKNDASANPFRTPRNPTSQLDSVTLRPASEPGKHDEKRVTGSAANGTSLPETFHTERKPQAIPGTASPEPIPGARRKTQQTVSQKLSSSFPWIESIKTGAKGWGWKVKARKEHHGESLDAIIREEEIKLVERVFPGTDQGSPRAVLFASLEEEAGCAPTCARVAEILAARSEGPVCVVDANFRTPSLHKYFGVENLKGLAEATVESGPIQEFAQQIPEPDLWMMPTGKAAAHLRFPAMADGLRVRMEELRSTFRYVVVHSGSLRLKTSAMLLSRWTDGVVLVVEANTTRRDTARRVKEVLSAANVRLLGVVLNNRTFPIPDAIYHRL